MDSRLEAEDESKHFTSYAQTSSLGKVVRFTIPILLQADSAAALMPEDALWGVVCQASQGLAFLHDHSVLHLDVKPDNIYLAGDTWRIGDFGLAVARDKEGSLVSGRSGTWSMEELSMSINEWWPGWHRLAYGHACQFCKGHACRDPHSVDSSSPGLGGGRRRLCCS
jgi:serine/threonine protein kinase